jgi:uncharacterized repeat protein (TIGR02543 family)
MRRRASLGLALAIGLADCVMGMDGGCVDEGRSSLNRTRDSATDSWSPDASVATGHDSGVGDEVEDPGSETPARDSGFGPLGADAELPPGDAGTEHRSDSGDASSGVGYSLAVSVSGSGMTSPAAGTHTYAAGTSVQVTAIPASGAAFTGWSGDASGTSNPVTIAMNGNKSLAASFSAQSYSLDIAVSGNGTTSPAAGTHSYAAGASVQVTAAPASGAAFTGWSGAASGTSNPVTIAMNGNKSLTANFSSSGLPSRCPQQCDAATPASPKLSSGGGLGNVTMFSTLASAGGACNYGSTKVMYYASINVNVQPGDGKGQWQSGRICGQCAEVTTLTSQGPKSVVVRIMDKCADSYCGINLAGSAPAAVMLDGAGRYDGEWRFLSCSGHPEVSDEAPSLAVIGGSNPDWARVRVHNPNSAVTSIEWQSTSGTASGSFPYATDPENAFEVPVDGVLQSKAASFLITVRYSDGSTSTAQLSPSQLAASNKTYPLN